jgi:protein AFG1
MVLQRELFLPFIDLVYERNIVHNLDSGVDYRLVGERAARSSILLAPPTPIVSSRQLFAQLVGSSAGAARARSRSRPTTPARIAASRCRAPPRALPTFTFDELCLDALGAAEYITLANHFHTVCVEGVPRMNVANKNEARRFIILIDELYEHRCKFACSARAAPDSLFAGPPAVSAERRAYIDKAVRESADNFELLFTGEEEAFMFARAQSRLQEMQSTAYLESTLARQRRRNETNEQKVNRNALKFSQVLASSFSMSRAWRARVARRRRGDCSAPRDAAAK